ncbi:transglycosylase SLT domain-containing protein [Blastococcus brunescens]|uniref:Transglycosylase SLT domain-containing protein n=1 Tax=Blastococcus brunescens TaxID=1564165 RepID=A0ABZ1BB10_9ACTN|nr:transglycosylase SLT domain-containing protein [Blastococcus sp. BMG 8361]WRL66799.1 transglycosylase SLT domain-containing protein [Blastococcus sp. BMG 8361]
MYLATAAAGAVLVGVVTAGEPPAEAAQLQSVSVAEQLGISAEAAPVTADELLAPLEQLAASRSERDAERAEAAAVQAAADQAEADRLAAEEAARVAAEEAARVAAEEAARVEAARAAEAAAAAARPGQGTSAPTAPAGSYKEYAMGKVGSASEFTCLENLWGKESGWNPNAQNPTSTAYGIAQFLDSTWAGTGIAKTSDGYRQIDAGLIYIENRFGSPCGAWSHSQSKGWY